MNYKKEKLNPETTTSSDNEITQAYNKAVKEGKLENVRLKDGRKIESEEDFRNYIDELNEDNNLATGGRAGFKSGSYLFTGLKDLGKKLDTKATSVFPNYPKDAIHRRKPDTIDGQVYADGTKEFKIEPMIDWLEGNNKYWSPLKFALSKPEKAYPTNSRGKPIELDD